MARKSISRTPEEHRAIVEALANAQRLQSALQQANATHSTKRKKRVKRNTARLNANKQANAKRKTRYYELSRFARE